MGQHYNGVTYFLGKCPKCGRVFLINPLNSPALCECNNVLSAGIFISYYMDSIIGSVEANKYVQGKCPSCGRNRLIDPEENYCECLGCKGYIASERFISSYNESVASSTYAGTQEGVGTAYPPTNIADFRIVEGELKEYIGNDTYVSIPTLVRRIGTEAFRWKKVERVNIPNSVIEIGNLAFADCVNLTHIDIPWSVSNIANNAFCRCGLQTVNVDDKNSVYDSRDNCNAVFESASNILVFGSENTRFPAGTTGIGDLSFCGRKNITRITIPDSVTSIGRYAFSDCSDLSSITIPPNVTAICEYTFQCCDKLSRVSLPDGLKSIETLAFADCPELIEISIPSSVNRIGRLAFARSNKISHIEIPCNVNSIEEGAFGLSGLQSITVDKNNKVFDSRDDCNAIIDSKSNTLISGCKNTNIPRSVTKIANFSFYCCTELREIIIPEGVTCIGEYAFAGCNALTSITIPDSVTSIGEHAFADCSSLKSIRIPNSINSIGKYAFSSCGALTIHCSKDSFAQKYAETNRVRYEIYPEKASRTEIAYQFSIVNKPTIGKCEKCQKETEVFSASISYNDKLKKMKLCKSCAISVKRAVDNKNNEQANASKSYSNTPSDISNASQRDETLSKRLKSIFGMIKGLVNKTYWANAYSEYISRNPQFSQGKVTLSNRIKIIIEMIKGLFEKSYWINTYSEYLEKERKAEEEAIRKAKEYETRSRAQAEQNNAIYRAVMVQAAKQKQAEINRMIELANKSKDNK